MLKKHIVVDHNEKQIVRSVGIDQKEVCDDEESSLERVYQRISW